MSKETLLKKIPVSIDNLDFLIQDIINESSKHPTEEKI